jgi:Arc/MetJ-type ribon-helix-helix transcriptional regulator
MTIHLPNDLESSIRAEVANGHFASIDDAIAEAVRSFLQQRKPPATNTGMGLIGALRDDADLLDQAVEHAMTVREERPWRLNAGE